MCYQKFTRSANSTFIVQNKAKQDAGGDHKTECLLHLRTSRFNHSRHLPVSGLASVLQTKTNI